MFRVPCGFRPKLVYFILKSILYSSWLLGIFPFIYDPKLRRLHRSKWLILYGMALSSGLLFLMLKPEAEAKDVQPKVDVFQRNAVLQQISFLLGAVGVLTICAMYLRTFWRSGSLERIYNELLHLELEYFFSDPEECRTFGTYVIQKGLLVAGGLGTTVVVHFGMPSESLPLVNVVVAALVKLGTFLLAIHFHLGVAFIYRFVWSINRELLGLASYLRVHPSGGSSRVHLLLDLYGQLVDLYGRLTDCYDYQTALMMVVFLAANINVSFYMIVYSVSLSKMSFFVMLILFPLALLNNFLDFWLSIAVCDLVERTGRQTSAILKLFNDIEGMDEALERSISDFALFCSHRRLKFLHCGLFHVNREKGFQMLVTSFLYLLFLVQFDFMNL